MIKNAYLAMAFSAIGILATVQPAVAQTDEVIFQLTPNSQFLNCLADPWSSEPPSANVIVARGKLNDFLYLEARHIKPHLKFDMFTVQNSPFLTGGAKDPNFKNFGLAWYQSDLEANREGTVRVLIRTILLDQIFGFDPNHSLPPTNTFHVGFWFNDPQDAAACGFDPSKPTPFNGEHKAGPLAMISVPGPSGLGPLCTNPDPSQNPVGCHP